MFVSISNRKHSVIDVTGSNFYIMILGKGYTKKLQMLKLTMSLTLYKLAFFGLFIAYLYNVKHVSLYKL